MVNAMFIGGPSAGDVISVGEECNEWHVLQMPKKQISLQLVTPEGQLIEKSKTQNFRYVKGTVQIEDGTLVYFRPEDMSAMDVMQELIGGYRFGVQAEKARG